ncbi:MAG: HlyD family efflux transporter periplasmic adaptor subunit [Planctomycetota bacterium]|jgi:biotin carboxyl carrier protein
MTVDDLQNNQFQILGDMTVAELIEQFHKFDGSPRQFLLNLLAAQCVLGQAEGGAFVRISPERDVDVLALYPQLKKDLPVPEWLTKSAEYAHEALSSDTALVKPLKEPGQLYDQPAKRHVLMVPLRMADIGEAVAVFVIGIDKTTALEASSQKLQLSIGMLSYSEMRPTRENWQQNCRRLQQTMETLSTVNQQDRFTSAAMAFCNEVASQWQCERVSIGFLKGRYVKLKAMSHTEDFSRKMKVVQDIESTMEECLDQDIEILSPAPRESTFIHRAADRLSKGHGPQTVLSLPLRRDGEVIAVVTLERPMERVFSLNEIETVRLACELSTARLADLCEYDRWIGGAILFLIFGKGQFRAEAPFVLEATYQQVVPAPFDGYIKSVEIEVGEEVEGGNSILGSLDTAELRLRLAEAKAEKAGYLKQSSAAMRDGETAQAQIAQASADKAQAQIELLDYQISQASLVSPISGVVVKGDLKREIGAPVQVGDVLFEVCPLELLRAQLLVPEDGIYDIEIGQEGHLATASYPGQRIKFEVERINPIAEVVNQRNVFKVRVQLLQTYQWMRPGMEGVAKVSVGKRHYAWIWTRKIINWIRMRLWF